MVQVGSQKYRMMFFLNIYYHIELVAKISLNLPLWLHHKIDKRNIEIWGQL
jgi:hypothetical protein